MGATFNAFYINVDGHDERRRFVEAGLSGAGIAAERIPGVKGADVPARLRPYFFSSDRPAPLKPEQIGCSASHLEAMRLVLERDMSAALVLEDDAHLDTDLSEVILAALQALPEGWDIVRLCRPTKRAVRPLAALPGGRKLVRFSRVPLGRAGYLVSRSGAAKLLKPRKVCAPGDVEITHPWLLDLDIYGVEPPPILQERRRFPSVIGGNRGRMSPWKRAAPDPRRLLFNMRKLGPLWWLRCTAANLARAIFGAPRREPPLKSAGARRA